MKPDSGQSAEQKQHAEAVDDVIDVEAIPGPLLLADAGHGAVEAVAEPVCREAHHHTQRASAG